jgi:dephospho-CoA kinase
MLKIGLTGNLNSGFINVSEMFKLQEVPVFEADIALKFLLNFRDDICRKIKIELGENIFSKGLIDHTKFSSTQKFDRLLDIVEPELFKLYDRFCSNHRDASYTIFKSSILFERNWDKKLNYTITTFKPKDTRALDISNQSGIRLVDAYSIVSSEMDDLVKNQKSEWIIHNYDKLSLLTQSKAIHDKIVELSFKKSLKIGYNDIKNVLTF